MGQVVKSYYNCSYGESKIISVNQFIMLYVVLTFLRN